jgi:hypothetical protein
MTSLTDLHEDPLYLAIGRDWRSTSLVNRQLLAVVRHSFHAAHGIRQTPCNTVHDVAICVCLLQVRRKKPVSLILSGKQGTTLQQLPLHRAWSNCRSLRYNHESFSCGTEELEVVASTLEYGADHWPHLEEIHLAGVGCR